jgi:hypothetical protein
MKPSRLRKALPHAKLVGLISAERWALLADEIGVPGKDRNDVRNDPSLIELRISRTRLLREVLDEHGPAIAMLADIVAFLEQHSLVARTTGEVATLPGLEELKPQHCQILSQWNAASRRRWKQDRKAETLWRDASDALDLMLDRSCDRPHARWKPIRGGDFYYYDQPDPTYHEFEVRLLRQQIEKIEHALPDMLDDELLDEIATRCSVITAELDELANARESGRHPTEDYEDEIEKVTILVERMTLTGELLESETGIANLLAVSVFRNLPQLYEAWLLCFILATLERAGYPVVLDQLRPVMGNIVWNLRYAGAKQPVAKVGANAWIFFQYKAAGHPTMPDFAIFDNPSAKGKALAVFDAKFSELHGYSMSDYVRTLDKYRSLGGRSLVLEYEVRDRLKSQPRVVFGVSPKGPGLTRLKSELFGIFVSTQAPAIAVIDQSPSFRPLLPKALRYILAAAKAKRLEDRYIPFSTAAILRSGLIEAIRSRKIEVAKDGGTALKPLRETLSAMRSAGAPRTLMLVTDGEFEDGTLDSLQDLAEAIWVLGPDDLGCS